MNYYFFKYVLVFLFVFSQLNSTDILKENQHSGSCDSPDINISAEERTKIYSPYIQSLYSIKEYLTFNTSDYKHAPLIYHYANAFFKTPPFHYNGMVCCLNNRIQHNPSLKNDGNQSYKIYPLTHRIWITDHDKPEEIPAEQLEFYEKSLTHYDKESLHFFWCLDPSKIPQSVQKLKHMGVEIRTINPNFFITKNLYEKLIRDKLFGFASNLARFEILYIYGGVYSDIGLEQTQDLSPILKTSDYALYLNPKGVLDIRAMGFDYDHPFLKEHLEFIEELPNLEENLKSINMGEGASRQGITTGYILNAKLPIFFQHNASRLILNFFREKAHFVYHGMERWKKPEVQAILKRDPLYFYNHEPNFDFNYLYDDFQSNLDFAKNNFDSFQTTPFESIQKIYKTNREILYQNLDHLYQKNAFLSHGEIPLISHRMWLTYDAKPIEASEQLIDYYLQSVQKLHQENPSWQHFFWCLDKTKIPKTVEQIESLKRQTNSDVPIIQVLDWKTYKDQYSNFMAEHLFFAALDHGLFSLASNLWRQNIMYAIGGLYTDLGTEFEKDPTILMQNAELILHFRKSKMKGREKSWWLDQDIFASIPNHPVICQVLKTIHDLHEIAKNTPEIYEIFDCPKKMHFWTSSQHLTIAALSSEKNENFVILPDNERIFKAHHQSSWFGSGNLKTCHDLYKTSLNWFDVTPDYMSNPLVRLRVQKFPFDQYRKFFHPDIQDDQTLLENFLNTPYGIQERNDEFEKLFIVNVTSFPPKIQLSILALLSILQQSMKPNRVIFWVSEDEFKGHLLPFAFEILKQKGLEIIFIPDNIKSYKKIVPGLLDPVIKKSNLVVADDDTFYPPNWFKKLIDKHHQFPSAVIAHRTRIVITSDEGELLSYQDWPLGNKFKGKLEWFSNFPTDSGGTLYSEGSLHMQTVENPDFVHICKGICDTGDDIMLYALSVLNRTPTYLVDDPKEIVDLNDAETKKASLYHSQNKRGKNDEMIKRVFQYFKVYQILGIKEPERK